MRKTPCYNEFAICIKIGSAIDIDNQKYTIVINPFHLTSHLRTQTHILPYWSNVSKPAQNASFEYLESVDNQYPFNSYFASSSTGKEKDPLRLYLQSGELCRARLTSPPDLLTGYSYFGARYLDHELMTMWLSVDPMADKYPSISPYAYCAWNPVKLVDPDGREVWKPEILLDGTVNYVAEKRDNAVTLQEQYGLTKIEAEWLYGTMSSNGRISGKNVASISKNHSELLRYNINYDSGTRMRNIQLQVYHVGFACLYNKAKQNGRPFKLNEFFSGLQSNYSGIVSRDGWGNTPKNLSVPALGGGEIPIRHLSCQSGGDVLIHQDGGHKQTADYTGFILLYTQMARTRTNYEMHAITITYPNESEDLIKKSYK